MKKVLMLAIAFVLIASGAALAQYNRAGRSIKKDMPTAGTYVALGISPYVPCLISSLSCYQNADMYLSFSSDGSNPIRIPAGGAYWDDTLLFEAEVYVAGTNNGDDACALIKQ